MYKVLKRFKDLKDHGYTYNAGEQYPRKGLKVGKRRLQELASDQNRRGIPLIQFVEEKNAN